MFVSYGEQDLFSCASVIGTAAQGPLVIINLTATIFCYEIQLLDIGIATLVTHRPAKHNLKLRDGTSLNLQYLAK